MRLNVRQKTIGTASDCFDYRRMKSRLDGDGLSHGVHFRRSFDPSRKVRRQPVQVEERRDEGIRALSKGVPKKTQHPLTLERAALRVPGIGNEPRDEEHVRIPQGGSQNLVHEDLFRLALTNDNDLGHRVGLPPSMFIFQSSPSA